MTDITFDCMGTHVRLLVADEADRRRVPRVPRRLRGRAQPLPPRQRAEPPQRRPGARGRRLAAAAHGDLRGPAGGGAHRRARRPDAHPGARGRSATTARGARPSSRSPRRCSAAPRAPAGGAEPARAVAARRRSASARSRARPACRLDTGGTGKGLAADLLAHRLARPLGGRLRRRPAGLRRLRRPRPPSAHAARPRTSSASRTARSRPPASTPGCGARPTGRRATTCSTRARCSRPGPA